MKRSITPRVDADAWCPSGRWGPRRVRVSECWAVLRAEDLYTALLRDDLSRARPGARGEVSWTLRTTETEPIQAATVSWELVANRVWRFGRVFLGCPNCRRRATRIYVPKAWAAPRCRTCWGLTYGSRQENYRPTGLFGAWLPSVAECQTQLRREARAIARSRRFMERRSLMACRTLHR